MASIDLSAGFLEPPEGITPDFEDPPKNNRIAAAAYTVMVAVGTFSIAVRIYGKVFLARKVQIEDYLIMAGYIAFIATIWSAIMFAEHPGYFVHSWNVTNEEGMEALYYAFVFGTLYSVALALIKIAIPLEWCRLFVPPGTKTKSYFWWGSMFVVCLQSLFLPVVVILLSVQCIPHEAIWDIRLQATASCFPLPALQQTSATIHFVTDLVIMALPQKIIYDLNLSWQKKLGLGFVFGLGILGLVCSVFRLADTIILAAEPDVFYYTGPVILWCCAEVTCGLFVAGAPIMPRVAKESRFLRRMLGSTNRSTGPTGGTATIGGGGRSRGLPNSRNKYDDYSQIDDEGGIPLGSRHVKSSESTEQLSENKPGSGGIIRTTDVVIQHDVSEPNNVKPAPWSQV